MNANNVKDRFRILLFGSLVLLIYSSTASFFEITGGSFKQTFSLADLIKLLEFTSDTKNYQYIVNTLRLIYLSIFISIILLIISFLKNSNRTQKISLASSTLVSAMTFLSLYEYLQFHRSITQIDSSVQIKFGNGFYALVLAFLISTGASVYAIWYFRKYGTIDYFLLETKKVPVNRPHEQITLSFNERKLTINPLVTLLAASSSVFFFLVKSLPFIEISFKNSSTTVSFTLQNLEELHNTLGITVVELKKTILYTNYALLTSMISSVVLIFLPKYKFKVWAMYSYLISAIFGVLAFLEYNSFFNKNGSLYFAYGSSVTVSRAQGLFILLGLSIFQIIIPIVALIKYRPLIKYAESPGTFEEQNDLNDDQKTDHIIIPNYYNFNLVKTLFVVSTLFLLFSNILSLMKLNESITFSNGKIVYGYNFNIREFQSEELFSNTYGTDLQVLEILLGLSLIISVIGTGLLVFPDLRSKQKLALITHLIATILSLASLWQVTRIVMDIQRQTEIIATSSQFDENSQIKIVFGAGYYFLIIATIMNIILLNHVYHNRSNVTEDEILNINYFTETLYRKNFQRNISIMISGILGIFAFRSLIILSINLQAFSIGINHSLGFEQRFRGLFPNELRHLQHESNSFWMFTNVAIFIQVLCIILILFAKNKRMETLTYAVSGFGSLILFAAIVQIMVMRYLLETNLQPLGDSTNTNITVDFEIGYYMLLIIAIVLMIPAFNEWKIIRSEKSKLKIIVQREENDTDVAEDTIESDPLYPEYVELFPTIENNKNK